MNNQFESLVCKWASLGVAFNQESDQYTNANPESVIIDTIKFSDFPKDKKLFSLMLLWVYEYHNLIHVEHLKSLMKTLTPFELSLLIGITKKILKKSGDLRFNAILKEATKIFGTTPPFFNTTDDDLLISMKGLDEDFLECGLRIVPLKEDHQKKLFKRDYVIKNNVWLKNRLIFGVNLRADFMTVFNLGVASNAYQAAKYLHCSLNASYRNWNDIVYAKDIGIIS